MAGVAQFAVAEKVLRLTALVTVEGQHLKNTWQCLLCDSILGFGLTQHHGLAAARACPSIARVERLASTSERTLSSIPLRYRKWEQRKL